MFIAQKHVYDYRTGPEPSPSPTPSTTATETPTPTPTPTIGSSPTPTPTPTPTPSITPSNSPTPAPPPSPVPPTFTRNGVGDYTINAWGGATATYYLVRLGGSTVLSGNFTTPTKRISGYSGTYELRAYSYANWTTPNYSSTVTTYMT